MIKQDVPLKYYRVFVEGGHVWRCLSEHLDIDELDKHIKKLKKDNKSFETCFLTPQQEIVYVCIDACKICGYELLPNTSTTVLADIDKQRKSQRTKILKKKAEKKQLNKNLVGQTVKRKK